MAGKKNVFLDFIVDDRQKSKLAGIGTEAGKADSKFKQLSTGTKALVGGLAAVAGTKIVSFLSDATKAALDDQKAQTQLKVALQNTTGATDDQVAAAESWIDTTARQTGITDDELRPALANLVRATGDVEEAQKLMTTAMDIATARGLPLEQVSLALTKAYNGNVSALGRMGLKVRDANGAVLSFEEAIAAVNETMGGATAEAAESAEGKFRRMQVAVDEAKESLGSLLLPVLAEAATGIVLLGTEIQQWTGQISDMDAAIQTWQTHMGESADTAAAALQIWKTGSIEWSELLDKLKLAPAELIKLREASDEFLLTQGVTNETLDEFRENTQNAINASMDSRAEQTKAVLKQQELGGAYELTTEDIRDQISANRELTDPLFAMISATDRVAEAQQRYADAVADGGANSAEAFDAAVDLAKAQQDLEGAAQIYASEGGAASIEALQNLLEEAGLLPDAIQQIIDQILKFNKTPVKNVRITGGTLIDDRRSSEARASGGPVAKGRSYLVGERGPEVITMGANGHVTPNHELGGSVYNINVTAGMGADPALIGRKVVESIKAYEKRNGSSWRR